MGIYVSGTLEGIDVNYTIDTGATATVVSSKIYQNIPESNRPELKRQTAKDLVNADGRPIVTWGRGHFSMTMGSLELRRELYVAEIEDDVLLGADLMLRDGDGPADLILSEGKMVFKGITIKVEQVITGAPCQVRKAYAADHYVIPGMSEAILDLFVDKHGCVDGDNHILIEGAPQFVENHSVVVAPCLVDAANNATVKVRVLNPFTQAVSVKQDTVVGHVLEINAEVNVIVEEESQEDIENHN